MLGCKTNADNNKIEKITQKKVDTKQLIVNKQIDSINKIIAEGDIIFRGDVGLESDIIRDFSINNKMFSHCGIVLKRDGKFVVAHIISGLSNPAGTILKQTINDFVLYPDNESVGVYKTNISAPQVLLLNYFIDSLIQKKILFDLTFNLFTKDKLYCTEMLIDALQYAKKNTTLFKPTIFNLKNTKYQHIANTGDCFYFYPIDAFEKSLIKKAIFLYPNYYKK